MKLHKADEKAARDTAARFVATAVLRRDVDDSWDLTAPELRGGLTRTQWKTGEIPVVPFPAKDLDEVRWRLDYSIEDHVGLKVSMLPRENSTAKALLFEMELVRTGPAAKRRWGYFALPILHGDRLVGKLDAAADHKASVLRVHAIHEDVLFTRAIAKGVQAELNDLAVWLRLDAVERP